MMETVLVSIPALLKKINDRKTFNLFKSICKKYTYFIHNLVHPFFS